jgi:orotidine-5'-phosphate decarboxylase
LKVGKELFVRAGPHLVEKLIARGYSIFLDLKFHDIPNTVAGACRAAADLGVWMINVHALGGSRMMDAAREALEVSCHRPLLTAVSVLTSLDAADLQALGIPLNPEECVLRWARLADRCGLDGMVCSAAEAPVIRDHLGHEPILVTPGIRPRGVAHDDQRRVVTPADALALGADYLVVGRPVTQSQDPRRAILAIDSEISDGDARSPLLV